MVRDQGRSVQAVWPAVGHLSAHVQMLGCIICNDVEDRGRQLSSPLHVSWVSDDMQISDMHFFYPFRAGSVSILVHICEPALSLYPNLGVL